MVDRGDVGGWLSGPKSTLAEQGIDLGYRGQRLGRPADGPGSVAGFGRRIAALAIDWLAALLVARLLFPELAADQRAGGGFGLVVLAVFGAEVAVLTWLTGSSFGQRILGLAVVRVQGGRVGVGAALARTALICLAVPPLIWDRDGRGLHDRATGSVCVRR